MRTSLNVNGLEIILLNTRPLAARALKLASGGLGIKF